MTELERARNEFYEKYDKGVIGSITPEIYNYITELQGELSRLKDDIENRD